MRATAWRRSTGEDPAEEGLPLKLGGGVREGAGTERGPHLRRLNQQQLSELRAQVEDLQKALQEQGGKTEDVSAHLLPAWPSPVPTTNPLLSPHCCLMPREVHSKYLGLRVPLPTLTRQEGWDLWTPHPHTHPAPLLSSSQSC